MEEPTPQNFVEFQSVRIKPHQIEFLRAPKGEIYYKKFTIQNVGKTMAFVRIAQSSNKFFQVEPTVPRGEHLSPGLTLSKILKLSDDDDDEIDTFVLPIFINEERFEYSIVKKFPVSIITIAPKELHFGTVDCGAMQRFININITNDGTKLTHFYVDVSKVNKLVSAEPLKGHLKPRSTVEVSFKVVSFKPINLDSWINIKCEGMVTRIPITATIILTQLESLHTNATEFFTLIEFPPTYYGLTSTEILLVKNNSAKIKMFCLKAEISNKCIELEDYRKENPDYDCFQLRPDNGLFMPSETKIFVITFSPSKYLHMDINQCYFATLLIKAFRCTHLDPSQHGNIFEDPDCILASRRPSQETEWSIISNMSFISLKKTYSSMLKCCSSSAISSMTSFQDRIDMAEYWHFLEHSEKDLVRIHLYGTAEIPGIQVIPDEIVIKGLKVNHREMRVLEIKNKSLILPIYVRYKKVAFIKVVPDFISLNPSRSMQVSVAVCTKNPGVQISNLTFEILYHDVPKKSDLKVLGEVKVKTTFEVVAQSIQPKCIINTGLAPNYIKEVGKHCHKLKFNTKLHQKLKAVAVVPCKQIDPNLNDVVALPNDTQKSIRPWRSQEPCRTIFTKQERYSAPVEKVYELSSLEQEYKDKIVAYYNSFIHRKALGEFGLKLIKEYPLTECSKVLLKDFICEDVATIERRVKYYPQSFLPLNPMQMNKILVWPTAIRTGQVASNHAYNFTLTIKNTNDFDIRLIIRSDKPNIFYFEGNRYVIKRNTEIPVNLVYKTFSSGYYNSNLDLIVNESMVLTIPIFAHVIPKAIHLTVRALTFEDNVTRKYIDLINKLNVRMSFTWVIVNDNFTIEPCTGSIQAASKLICMVCFFPEIPGPTETEATLHSGDASIKKIKLIAEVKVRNLQLITEKVIFKDVPLNKVIMQKAIVKNPLTYPLVFCIDDTEISKVIKIYPLKGTVQPLCHYAIYLFTTNILNCIQFQYNVKIHTLRAGDILLPIYGNVVFPKIEITPHILKLEKIPVHTRTSKIINLHNVSSAPATVKFDMSETSATYKIKESYKWDSSEVEDLYLLPSENASVYVHFEPEFAVFYDFYLPVIINGILGPPVLTDYISTRTEYYLVTTYEGCTYPKMPPTIPCCKIQSFAAVPKFDISCTYVKLATNVLQRKAYYNLVIKNRQNVEDNIYIQTDFVFHPLYIKDKKQGYRKRYTYRLPPKGEVDIIISFKPGKTDFGTLRCTLPLFIRSEVTNYFYTNICVDATYEKPTMFIAYPNSENLIEIPEQVRLKDDYIFFLRPFPAIPIDVINRRILHLKGHLSTCVVKSETDIEVMFSKQIGSKNQIDTNYYTTEVILGTNLTETAQCDGFWKMTCSCGGVWAQRLVGTFESSLLTNYVFTEMYWRKLIKFGTNGQLIPVRLDASEDCTNFFRPYPFIPYDNSPLGTLFKNVVLAVETWTKTQIFYGEMYYQIPSGINSIRFTPPPEVCIKRQTRLCSIPFGQIFITLIGPQMYEYLGLRSGDMEEHEKVPYLISVYQKGLDLLKKRGASLNYVRPEYLLDYHHFVIYKDIMYNESEIPHPLSSAISDVWDFYKIGKASWLDVLIQIFKVFCMSRIRNTFYERSAKPSNNFEDFSVSNHVQKLPGILSETESLLLSWLEFHFNKNKDLLWNQKLAERNVVLYDDTLKDGLVYAAVTASYCPYLIPILKNVYVDTCSHEEKVHNNNTVIQCWEKLNYSFHVTAPALVATNSIRTLMFTAYLFEVLPSMYPTSTLKFKTTLSTSAIQKLTLSNSNDFPIAYKIMFIGNEHESFETNHDFIVISPNSSKTVRVKYFAKFARQVTSTLLLSGECTGYKYANNKCVNLEGDPDLSQASSVITYPVDIYDVKEVKFTLQSPYKIDTSYEVQQTYDEIFEPLELSNVLYHNQRLQVDCGRFIPTNEQYIFDEAGVGEISGIITVAIDADVSTWLFFRNATVGDFSVKIVTIARESKEKEVLTVMVPKKYDRLTVEIPFKNQLFLECMIKLLLKITKDREYRLWKRIIDTPMGVNVLGRLYEFTIPTGMSVPIHCKSGVYEIRVLDGGANVQLPESVELPTECGSGGLPVSVKIKDQRAPLQDFYMILTSNALRRKRYYYVKFVNEEE